MLLHVPLCFALPASQRGESGVGLVWVGVETQTPFLQITRLLVEAREEIPRPRWTFFPLSLSLFSPSQRRGVVVVLLLCLRFSCTVLCRCTCARGVHASFVLYMAYRTIVHTAYILYCTIEIQNHTYLTAHTHPDRCTTSYHITQHPCPHMRRHDTYRRTSSVPSQKATHLTDA